MSAPDENMKRISNPRTSLIIYGSINVIQSHSVWILHEEHKPDMEQEEYPIFIM